jgi:tetratricopeptide (TPR) repeat protein
MPAAEARMTADRRSQDSDILHERAYAAFDAGDLIDARARFELLLAVKPDAPDYHYMQGLVCKYLQDWPISLHHNLQSLALRTEPDEASRWNAAIAATAIGDWAEARRQWADCGIELPDGDGAINSNFGVASIRLNAWDAGETLFGRRIDPVRARLINVPLPDSGYRYGDIVLHDGAATGQRRFHQSMVPVFNAMQRVEASEFQTFAIFATCPRHEDLDALVEARMPGIAFIEDWTESITHYCLRCSYGTPHRHLEEDANADDDAWRPERNLGIAAQSRHSVMKLLEHWKSKAIGRRLDAIESRDAVPSSPPNCGERWWLSPDDRDDEQGEDVD